MKRCLFKLALFLLLGAIVNVAVAWGCAWQAKFDLFRLPRDWGSIRRTTDTITFGEFTTFGASRVVMNFWTHPVPGSAPLFPPNTLPYWAESEVSDWDDALDGYPIDSAGIPLRCVRCKWMNNWTLYDGIPLHNDQFSWASNFGRSALPLRPIWPGIAINTIFYAVILWILWLSPFVIRRIIRRKRGRCIKCGYDLRVTSGGCPECGWGRDTATSNSAESIKKPPSDLGRTSG